MPTDGPVIVRDQEVCGGRPIFRGTRVFADTLFENLASGLSIAEILEEFPTLDRGDLERALQEACALLIKQAPQSTRDHSAEAALAGIPR